MTHTHEFKPVFYSAMAAWYAAGCVGEYPHVQHQMPGDDAWHDDRAVPVFEPGVLYRMKNAVQTVQEPVALPGDLVIKALRAMDAEARKRGEMYPQTLDEQREDTKAVRNVIASLEFYTSKKQCSNGWPSVKDWPALPAPVAQPVQPALTDAQIQAIKVCRTAGRVSVSQVQRMLCIGYNQAQELCQSIVDAGQCEGLILAPSIVRTGGAG